MDLEEVAAVLRTCTCCKHEQPLSFPPLPTYTRELQPSLKNLQMPPTTPFTKLLFQREYVLVMHELLAFRERLIGSKALIAMVAAGKAPAELKGAITCTSDLAWPIFWSAHYYIRDAAWGDAGFRYRGMLPEVEEVPVVPYVTALKAKPMDWSEFWQYVDRERKEGSLKDKAAWADPQGALRTRVQRTLKGLNTKFIDLVGMHNSIALFMENDDMRFMSQEMVDEALSYLEAPPGPVQAAWNRTTDLPLEFLEHIHSHGRAVRNYLGDFARQAGNHYFNKFNAAKGEAAREDLSIDVLVEYKVARPILEQTAMVCSNEAALYLQMKNYKEAMASAEQGLGATLTYRAEPITFTARRTVVLQELRTSELRRVPVIPYLRQSKAQKQAENMLVRKLWLRKGRAEAAQCLLLLRAQAVPKLNEETTKLRNDATHSFEACYLMGPTDSMPRKECKEFFDALHTLIGPMSE